ncbi:MAG: chemotaxis protein CheW [Oscillospiraceae bacterium]|nr:chemotaxis protein CheW [Oscillospiraceae bacterium]MDD7430024.1 chemotaxis protein CheW [Oscillospiraceae bacterium]MDY2846729.1 chemotaxis protein CheW [Oscillospiraceae bacterium]
MEQESKWLSSEDSITENGYMIFLINGEYYAFPIDGVQEIISVPKIVPVPEFPDYAKGIVNVRGTIIPIIDTRLRFHMAELEYGSRTCIITIKCRDMIVGFIVDTVESVINISSGAIRPVPKISERTAEYLWGVAKLNDKIIMLLDPEKMLTEEMLKEVRDSIPENNNT